MDRKPLLTVKEASEILRINYRVLGRWINSGRIRAVDLGTGKRHILRIDPDEIDLYLKKQAFGGYLGWLYGEGSTSEGAESHTQIARRLRGWPSERLTNRGSLYNWQPPIPSGVC